MAANIPRHRRVQLRADCWRLMLDGKPQSAIADELGIGQLTVCRYLARQAERAAAPLDGEAAIAIVSEVRQLELVIYEADLAYRRSCSPLEEGSKSTIEGGGKGPVKTTTQRVLKRVGDPAWLTLKMSAMKRRSELLAVPARYAPPPPDDRQSGARDLASALLEAEARDAAYRPDDGAHPSDEGTADHEQPDAPEAD